MYPRFVSDTHTSSEAPGKQAVCHPQLDTCRYRGKAASAPCPSTHHHWLWLFWKGIVPPGKVHHHFFFSLSRGTREGRKKIVKVDAWESREREGVWPGWLLAGWLPPHLPLASSLSVCLSIPFQSDRLGIPYTLMGAMETDGILLPILPSYSIYEKTKTDIRIQ